MASLNLNISFRFEDKPKEVFCHVVLNEFVVVTKTSETVWTVKWNLKVGVLKDNTPRHTVWSWGMVWCRARSWSRVSLWVPSKWAYSVMLWWKMTFLKAIVWTPYLLVETRKELFPLLHFTGLSTERARACVIPIWSGVKMVMSLQKQLEKQEF